MSDRPVTPVTVERRLFNLSAALDDAQDHLAASELAYQTAKASYEIANARAFITVTASSATMREKLAIVETADQRMALALTEATVRAARGNITRIVTQIDVARSIGASVRSSLTL